MVDFRGVTVAKGTDIWIKADTFGWKRYPLQQVCNMIFFFQFALKNLISLLHLATQIGECRFLWRYPSLCEGMRRNSANNMTYIPNEGVDMHRDAGPGASSGSHCNTMDIIITWGDFKLLWVSSCTKPQTTATATSEANKQTQHDIWYFSGSDKATYSFSVTHLKILPLHTLKCIPPYAYTVPMSTTHILGLVMLTHFWPVIVRCCSFGTHFQLIITSPNLNKNIKFEL